MRWTTIRSLVATALCAAVVGTATPALGQQAGPAAAGPEAAAAAGPDHDQVIGRFAVGYLGWRDIAHGTIDNRESAPVVGVRYWLNKLVGIDGGLGFSTSGGEDSVTVGGTTTIDDQGGPTVFIIHGGVPLSLAASQHFSFEVVPELNIGFSSQTVEGGGTDDSDLELSGFHFDIGARVGGEIQFGFIDVPELSLQASVGLLFVSESAEANDTGANTTVEQDRNRFATTVYDNPWNIFIANVAALYYF